MEQDKIRGLGNSIEFIFIDEVERSAREKQKAWDEYHSNRQVCDKELNSMIFDGSSEMGGMWDETIVLDGLPKLTKAETDAMNLGAADIAAPKNRAQRRARNSKLRKLEVKGRK